MPGTTLFRALTAAVSFQDPESGWLQSLGLTPEVLLDAGVLLLAFTLAIFIVLVFGVRVLLIVTKKPVPVDFFDMAKPIAFRALMLGAAALLAPLVARGFLPFRSTDPQQVFLIAYALEIVVVAILWLALHLFYKVRTDRARRKK